MPSALLTCFDASVPTELTLPIRARPLDYLPLPACPRLPRNAQGAPARRSAWRGEQKRRPCRDASGASLLELLLNAAAVPPAVHNPSIQSCTFSSAVTGGHADWSVMHMSS